MTLERFEELFSELTMSERVSIYNNYCFEHGCADEALEEFDDEFFETYFSNANPIEVCRATFFGNIQNWSDAYIRFNAYGNLESVNEFDARDIIHDHIEEIFDYPECWEDCIDDEEVDEDQENEGDD